MSYPDYSRAERMADAIVHVAGITLALAGTVALFGLSGLPLDGGQLMAVGVYAAALVLMLTVSGLYHMTAHTPARPILRRLDHAAIYVKIAGTFTPLGVMLGTVFGYVIIGVVWLLALLGAVTKLMTRPGGMTTGWLPYMALGWAGVLLFIPLWAVLPGASLALILAGGLTYSAGIVFYCWDSLKFANAIWHLFTLVASAFFFFAIVNGLAGTA